MYVATRLFMKEIKKITTNAEKLVLALVDQAEIKKIIQECIRNELNFHLNNSKAPPNVHLISRKEAALILGISLPTLNAWTKQGKIPAYRIGSTVRYKQNEVEDSLKKIKSINY